MRIRYRCSCTSEIEGVVERGRESESKEFVKEEQVSVSLRVDEWKSEHAACPKLFLDMMASAALRGAERGA